MRFEDVEQLGAAEESGPVAPRPDSLATVCFSRLATAGPALLGRPKVGISRYATEAGLQC